MTFGGTTPLVIVWLVDATGDKLAVIYYLMVLAVLSLVCVVFARRRLGIR
jgi:MFS transporter, MHS family, proline/betaine transporter